ncbi:MAG: C40 family peptidase, partial [Solirubrobacteraceae bacterium]|nr:C40 family peptidase [Solirubrobacteraceae bacterium]
MHHSAAKLLRTATLVVALGLAGATSASAARSGGVTLDAPVAPTAITKPTTPGAVAKLQKDGTALAPADAPLEVQQAVWAANKLIGKPYRYGGGHARFNDTGYDCSGTVSFALKGAKALKSPLDSSSFMSWGEAGEGEWITVYTNPGHAFVVIAGLRLDTSASGDPSGNKGPRWRPVLRSTKG